MHSIPYDKTGFIRFSAVKTGRDDSPNKFIIRGIEGPNKSASSKPTRLFSFISDSAKFTKI